MSLKIFTFSGLLSLSCLVQAQWTNRYNGQGDRSDVLNTMTTATDGHVYAAGYTINPEVSKDILLIKYSASGDTVWTRQFAGAGEGPDEALDIAMDPAGNVILTGYQKGAGTGFDFITLKYTPSGSLVWSAVYNYSTNESDQSNVLAIDNAGNIYIAGQSDKDNSPVNDDDYVAVKYNSSGIQQWAKRSDGFGGSTDRPAEIAIAPDGHVVVTGRSDNGNDDDYLTIKYNSTTGNEMWRSYFDRTHNDRATDLAITGSGNIYVTGRSNNGDNFDYATLCYNSSGTEQWQAIFDYVEDDRATHIALDNSGNVYVTGHSDADVSTVSLNYNILTIKYNSAGTQQYVQSYEGPAANDDIPSGLWVDASGNATVSGHADTESGAGIQNAAVVLRYSNAGVLSWSTLLDDAGRNVITDALAVDATGKIYVAGYTESVPDRNTILFQLNTAGDEQWKRTWNGVGDNGDNMHALVRDGLNNIVLAGYTTAFDADRNFLVMKLGADGDLVWTRTFNGTSTRQSTDDAMALTVDNDHNIYAAGFVKNSGTGYDMFVCKLNKNGDSVWVYQYNDAAANETDKAIGIHVSGTGDITICGRSDQDATAASNDDIVVIRLNNAGVQQWMSRYNGTGNGDDFPKQMIVSAAGNVYVTGKTFNGTDMDAVVIKYNASGAQQWVKKYDGGHGDDEGVSMVLNAEESVFISGTTTTVNGDADVLMLSYASNGSLLHTATFDTGMQGDDEVKYMTADADDQYYIAYTANSDTSAITLDGDIAILQINDACDYQWHTVYDGGAHDDASDIAFDPATGIVVTGQTDLGTAGALDYDYVTLYVSAEGSISTTETYQGTGSGNDVANTLIAKENGVYTSGGSTGDGTQRDIVTILYGTTPSAITQAEVVADALIYPVPATTGIHVELMTDASAEFRLIGMQGQLLQRGTFINGRGYISLENYPAGLYTLSIETADGGSDHIIIKQ